MEVLSRSGWGARQPTRTPRTIPAGDRRGVVYHWTGDADTSLDNHERDHARCDDDTRNLQNYHMDSRDWSDFAYSFHVCIHGTVYVVRGWTWDQFANGSPDKNASLGYDKDWYTIHFGLGRGGVPTPAMLAAGRWIVAEARRRGAGKEVRRHDEFKFKVCPGPALTAEVKRIIADGLDPVPVDLGTVDMRLPVLGLGAKGPMVGHVQRALGIPVTEVFDQATLQAVGDAHVRWGWPRGDQVGGDTYKALGFGIKV